MTPAHCRAARALLGWSQNDLASKAGVSRSTIADFERGSRKPISRTMIEAMMRAFREGRIAQAAADFAKSFDPE
jgi:transcriptional regulator with XRE-family HTH domain